MLPLLARPGLAGRGLTGGGAVLVAAGRHRPGARWPGTHRPGAHWPAARRALARPSRRRPAMVLVVRGLLVRCVRGPVGSARLPGRASLAGPAARGRLAGAPGWPRAAVGA